MREQVRDKGRLEHILQAIDNVASFIQGKTYEDFAKEDVVYYAVVKNSNTCREEEFLLFRLQRSEAERPRVYS